MGPVTLSTAFSSPTLRRSQHLSHRMDLSRASSQVDMVYQTQELLRPSQYLLRHGQLRQLSQSNHDRYEREIQEQILEHHEQLEQKLYCDRKLHCNIRL